MILAYDIGTSHIKGAVVSSSGKVVSRAQVPVRMRESKDPTHRESDPDDWLAGLAIVTAELGLREKGRIRGVVVSANGPTLVAVNRDGEPLDNAMTWMDRRAQEEADLIAEFSDAPLDASFYLPKALWIMRHRPEMYEKTQHFLACAEYVCFFLSGNPSRIIPTPLFKEFFWNEEAIPQLHMDADKFPPYLEPGEIVGTVSQRAQEAIGIPAGIPVIAGGPDYVMSILGTAAITVGRACDRAGTSEGINLCWAAPVRDPRLLCFPHIVRGEYNVSAMLSSSGSAIEWAARTLGKRGTDFETVWKDAQAARPGANRLLFLPFLGTERFPIWDKRLRGSFLGLTLSHGRREMMRAVVESTGFAVRGILSAMEANRCKVTDLRVSGGQSRHPLWCQVRADITGKNVLLPEQEDTDLVGNACVGFYAVEEYGSLSSACEGMVRFKKTFMPNPDTLALYDELYSVFSRSCADLGDTLEDL
ncbi:MAG TPA: FGGY-family carbohydrate kinase [Spirochaetia bacterium]|nr:FGGY-family carbohydrate kinase [Spirochaetia bacterium]